MSSTSHCHPWPAFFKFRCLCDCISSCKNRLGCLVYSFVLFCCLFFQFSSRLWGAVPRAVTTEALKASWAPESPPERIRNIFLIFWTRRINTCCTASSVQKPFRAKLNPKLFETPHRSETVKALHTESCKSHLLLVLIKQSVFFSVKCSI